MKTIGKRSLLAALVLVAGLSVAMPSRAYAQIGQSPDGAAPTTTLSMGEDFSTQFPPFEKSPGTDPFAQGRWTLQLYGSGTSSKNTDGLYSGHVGVGYHFRDGISINAEFVGSAIQMQNTKHDAGGDSASGAFDLILRWHFLRGDGWSIFGDVGGGVMESMESFPANGSHFNFRPQAGLGATLRITDDCYLMGGVKWLHVSNANLRERNPGFDSAMFYMGLMFPF